MDIKEMREKTDLELQRLLVERRNRLRDLRFRVAARQLADVRDIPEVRRDIARLMTLLTEHQAEGSEEQPAPSEEKAEAPVKEKKPAAQPKK